LYKKSRKLWIMHFVGRSEYNNRNKLMQRGLRMDLEKVVARIGKSSREFNWRNLNV
jgi:hypothetical protein